MAVPYKKSLGIPTLLSCAMDRAGVQSSLSKYMTKSGFIIDTALPPARVGKLSSRVDIPDQALAKTRTISTRSVTSSGRTERTYIVRGAELCTACAQR